MNNKRLSVTGIGPIYVSIILITTFILVILEINGKLPRYEISIHILPIAIGIIVMVIGAVLWISAVISSKIIKNIKSNVLVTTGVFKYVRNPIYSSFMLVCTGVLCILNNMILLIAPVFYWGLMTALLVCTEEKWLRDLYKDEYVEYCKKVNRCIPMVR